MSLNMFILMIKSVSLMASLNCICVTETFIRSDTRFLFYFLLTDTKT